MSIKITSVQNPRVKFALSLRKPAVRKRENLFTIEGKREIRLAMLAGYQFKSLFLCHELAEGKPAAEEGQDPGFTANHIAGVLTGQSEILATDKSVFERLVYREGSDGLLAIAYQKRYDLARLKPGVNPLVIIAESLEKPGNMGAILRSADAAGADAVIFCDSNTDIYNPNVVRSSLGCLFTLPVVCSTSAEAVRWLKDNGISIFTTSLTGSVPYHEADYRGPSAIVAGAEATGVSDIWQQMSDKNIRIPMFGKVDSMNVSAATSVVVYEALRQRGFRHRCKSG